MTNPPLDAHEALLRFLRLRSCVFDFARKLAQNEAPQIDSAACVVNINSDQIALRIVVEHDALRDFPTVDARPLREVNVQRVRIGEVVEFHGSMLPRPTSIEFRLRLSDGTVELARPNIGFNFGVPGLPILIQDPVAQLRKFRLGQLPDLVLNMLDLAHGYGLRRQAAL